MTVLEAEKNAIKYLREQAWIIGKYGKAPKLSGESYQAALEATAKTFQSLSERRTY